MTKQRAKAAAGAAPFLPAKPTPGPLYWAHLLAGSTALLVAEPLTRLILWANKAIG